MIGLSARGNKRFVQISVIAGADNRRFSGALRRHLTQPPSGSWAARMGGGSNGGEGDQARAARRAGLHGLFAGGEWIRTSSTRKRSSWLSPSCAGCLGRVGALRFSSFFYERQAIRQSLAPTNIGSSPNSAHELEHSDPLGDVGGACDAQLAAYGP